MLDLVGFRSGRLVALERAFKVAGGYKWKCQCDCGNITYVLGTKLKQHTTRSCGCLHIETGQTINLQHGDSKSRLYNVWASMKSRCYNPHNSRYSSYGGRGIKVCDEWLDYKNFMQWAIANGYDYTAEYGKTTIDRIDVDGDYTPENCRFADLKTQANNTRRCVYIEHGGEVKTMSEWAITLGISESSFRERLERKLPDERLFHKGSLRLETKS